MSWIKVEISTPDKPEVFSIAAVLGIDVDAVVGKLVRFWAWADTNLVDGRASTHVDAVRTQVDRICNCAGMFDAIVQENWIVVDKNKKGFRIPNFHYHNGESAKKRSLKTKRQARYRKSESRDVDALPSTDVDAHVDAPPSTSVDAHVDAAEPPDKRREEKIKDIKENNKKKKNCSVISQSQLQEMGVSEKSARDHLAVRKAKRSPLTESALNGLVKNFEKAGISLVEGFDILAEKGWIGFKSEWLKNEKDRSGDDRNAVSRATLDIDTTNY